VKISRQLAHKITNGLQLIVSATELNMSKVVIDKARELAVLVNSNVETLQEEKARKQREAD